MWRRSTSSGLPGKRRGIEVLHFLDETIDLAGSFGIVLKLLAELAQIFHVLLDFALGVAGICTAVGSDGIRQLRVVAGIEIAVVAGAIAITAPVAATEGGAEAAARAVAVIHAAGLIVAASTGCADLNLP